jgi:hypothetical protein
MNRYSSQPVVGFAGAAFQSAESAAEGPMLARLWQAFSGLRGGGDTTEIAEELCQLCRQCCEIHGIDVELVGVLPAGPAVLVANHLGYIDPVVLCSLVPCSPIA